MKTGKFKKVSFTMQRQVGYGSYLITSNYRGKKIEVHTNDSEAWDWLDDDSNKEKQNNARRHCYYMIVAKFENTINNY